MRAGRTDGCGSRDALRSIGAAERALELLCQRALTRTTFGRRVAERSNIMDWIAEARIDLIAQAWSVLSGAADPELAAAAMALWVTFVPCFLWVLALAPFVEWIATRPRLGAALKGISAAVVGVIGTLAVWFAMHVFFGATATLVFGPLSVTLPDLGSAKLLPIGIALTAGWLLLVLHWNLVAALALSALAGAGAAFIAPASQALMADIIGSNRSGGQALSTYSMSMDLGSIAGTLVAGAIADAVGFGWAFAVTGIVMGAAVVPWLFVRGRPWRART